MKLGDIILNEAPLASYGKNYAGPRLGPNNIGFPDGRTIIQLKTALARHQLYQPGQQPNPANKAWIGDNSGEWSQALSDAIIQWKRSINAQDARARLDDSTPELSPRAIDYLLDVKLYGPDQQSMAGLLNLGDDNSSQKTTSAPPWKSETLDVNTIINTPTENIKNVRDFLSAITFSGWAVILEELIAKKEFQEGTRGAEMQRMLKEIYVKQNHTPVIWLQSWEDNVLREQGEDLTATFANGEEVPFHPINSSSFNTNWGSVQLGSQRLYEYFKMLGNGLLRKYQQQLTQAQAAENSEKAVDDRPTIVDQQTQRVWARDMNTALANAWYDVIPGLGGPDTSSVRDLMMQLKTAGDWDTLSAKYEEMFKENLSNRLVEELSDEDYESYVYRNLSRIRRINPSPLFAAIKFGNTEDSIDVDYENVKYTIMKAKVKGRPVIKAGNNEIKDVIIIDSVLKIAITQTGGTVPDFNVEVTTEKFEEAANFVIIAVQNTAPFMVPYYTTQVPFDQAIVPGKGPQRLKGLTEEASRLLSNGVSNEGILDWLQQQITNDAQEIIETEELHWDERWKTEDPVNILNKFGGILDVQDATDEEKDLVARLHNSSTREDAVDELLATNDPESRYERIYRVFKNEHSRTFDERVFGNDTDPLRDYVVNGTPTPDLGFNKVLNTIGPAKAAPLMMAKLFEDSMEGSWWTAGIGTDEELADKLTDAIMDKEDYLLVNEYYKGAPVNASDDLIDDMAGEQWFGLFSDTYYNKLAGEIGAPNLALARAELDGQLLNVITDLTEEPNERNLKRIKDLVNRPSNNYFAILNNDGAPTKRINRDGIEAFYKALDNIRLANATLFNQDENLQELMFQILDGVDNEVERMHNEEKFSGNNNTYGYWKSWYETAKTEWFAE